MAGLSKERELFEKVMAKHTARLVDNARPMVSRLSEKDRQLLLSIALEIAWARHEEFNYQEGKLINWWRGCLEAAALTRPHWLIYYSHKVERISGRDLARRR